MSYYIGFLKKSKSDAVIFKSINRPKRHDYNYFIKVAGPYMSWETAKLGLKRFKGYKENPITNLISKSDIMEAVRLSKGVYKLYKSVRKKNPGKSYHDKKFLGYMRELDKHTLGSVPYISTLAKAYEHLQSAQDSVREKV